MGFFLSQFSLITSNIGNINFYVDLNKSINIFEPSSNKHGAEVTISSHKSRKSFHLVKPTQDKTKAPIAIESFAIDPDEYFELMKRVEIFLKRSK